MQWGGGSVPTLKCGCTVTSFQSMVRKGRKSHFPEETPTAPRPARRSASQRRVRGQCPLHPRLLPRPPRAGRPRTACPGPHAPSRRIENHASPGRQRGPRCTAASVPCDCDVVTHKSDTTCEAPHSQQVFGSSGLRGQSGSQGLTQPTPDSWSQRPPLGEGLVPRTVPTSAANRTSGLPDP